MKKKIFAILMATTMTASLLAGCGNSKTTGSAEATTAFSMTTQGAYADQKVGVCISEFNNSFTSSYRNELMSYLIDLGFAEENIFIVNSASDQSLQNNQVHNFVVDGYNLIMIDPVSTDAVSEMTDRVTTAGIPLVYINHEPSSDEEARWTANNWKVSYVGTDRTQAGTLQGEIIADLGLEAVDFNKNNKVDYIMVEGNQDDTDMKSRTEQSVKAIEKKGLKTKKREVTQAEGDQTKAQQQVTGLLAEEKGQKTEVILCNNDAMALGAMQGIADSKRTVGTDILLVGADGTLEAVKAVAAGTMTGTVLNDYMTQAHTAADVGLNYIKGGENEKKILVDYVKVTQQNANDVLKNIFGEE